MPSGRTPASLWVSWNSAASAAPLPYTATRLKFERCRRMGAVAYLSEQPESRGDRG